MIDYLTTEAQRTQSSIIFLCALCVSVVNLILKLH